MLFTERSKSARQGGWRTIIDAEKSRFCLDYGLLQDENPDNDSMRVKAEYTKLWEIVEMEFQDKERW